MDELDDITEEEMRCAEALAQELARPADGEREGDTVELSSLQTHAALLRASRNWEAGPATLSRGRADLLSHVQTRAPRRSGRAHWLFWLPLPVACALLFTFTRGGLQRSSREEPVAASSPASAEMKASDEEGFEPVPPRFHLGQTPASLLRAQAEVLRHRELGSERNQARASLEQEMRRYRGTLIASLELGGR